MRNRGRRIAISATILGGLTMVCAAVALRDRAWEEWWIWKLGSKDLSVRKLACERLGEIGSARAIPHLLELWSHRDPREGLPRYSETTLCTLGSRDPGALVRGLGDSSAWVRSVSVQTLLKIGAPPEAIPALALMLLDTESRERQRSACLALLELGPEGMPHALSTLEKDPDLLATVLEAIPEGIGQDNPHAAAMVLKELLSTDDLVILDEVLFRIVKICQQRRIDEIPMIHQGPNAEKVDPRATLRKELIAMLHQVPASRPAAVRQAFARTVFRLDRPAIEEERRLPQLRAKIDSLRHDGLEAPPPALEASGGEIRQPVEAGMGQDLPGQEK